MDAAPRPTEIVTVDIRGEICPASLLVTLRKINELKDSLREGRTALLVLTERRESVGTLSEAAFNMGYAVRSEEREGYFEMRIDCAR